MPAASSISSRRKDLSQSRRAAILKAARTVFARQGFAKTVIEDIAAEAEIGKGTVYLYFHSKEELYEDVLLEGARELERRSREAISAAPTWKDKVRTYMQVRLEFLSLHEDCVKLYAT